MIRQVALFLVLVSLAFTVKSCPEHEIEIYNGCPFTIWPAVLSTKHPQTNGGFKLENYQSRSIQVPCDWAAARVWARTDCDDSGINCMTGDCGSMSCQGSGQPDATLAEFTLNGSGDQDFYDISAVDGYNLPVAIEPIDSDCKTTMCKYDFRNNCDDQLKESKDGRVVSCLSACTKFNTDWYCCRGQYNSPDSCEAKDNSLVRFFKNQCNDMYSFAYDDQISTFTCPGNTGTKYKVSFCPA